MLCGIWYHLYNLKNMNNTNGRVLLLACNFTKSKTVFFSRFLNCTNGNKPSKASHMSINRENDIVLNFLRHLQGTSTIATSKMPIRK